MQRYVVLRDVTDPELRPIGLAVERPRAVRLYLTHDCGIRTEYDQPYTVHEPDGAELVYSPGDNEYFDHVILSLSRTFLVEEVVTAAEGIDEEDILSFYYERVASQQGVRPRPYVDREPVESGSVAVAYTYKPVASPAQPVATRARSRDLARAA